MEYTSNLKVYLIKHQENEGLIKKMANRLLDITV